MKRLRITPLNIVSSALITWLVWQLLRSQITFFYQGLLLLFLFVILVVADQYFRISVRSLKRIWLIQGLFIIIVLVAIWMIAFWYI